MKIPLVHECCLGRRPSARLAGATFALACLTACTPGKAFIATASDYSAYRATRIGATFDERVGAAARYLERHPNGAYADEVRRTFSKAEPLFYERKQKTAADLERYLTVLPDGPHAKEAKDALAFAIAREGRPDDLLVLATSTRLRLEANARSRAHARGELSSWLERAMAKGVFSAPLSEGPKELLIPFTLGLPEPRCAPITSASKGTTRRCRKLLSLPFVIPAKRSYEQHELTFEISIETAADTTPRRIVLSGPDLFARLQETYAKNAIESVDLAKRIDAVERAVDVVTGAFEAQVSIEPTCAKDVAAPDVVHLECNGIAVVATLGGGADGDDIVEIKPAD